MLLCELVALVVIWFLCSAAVFFANVYGNLPAIADYVAKDQHLTHLLPFFAILAALCAFAKVYAMACWMLSALLLCKGLKLRGAGAPLTWNLVWSLLYLGFSTPLPHGGVFGGPTKFQRRILELFNPFERLSCQQIADRLTSSGGELPLMDETVFVQTAMLAYKDLLDWEPGFTGHWKVTIYFTLNNKGISARREVKAKIKQTSSTEGAIAT
ncbi:hypothetical protein [Gloeobacter morelensis]|uniref:hypothetical protein n=1 Tax=Gloeobacter morelensis TaxID=2907343 RepID=UPI001E632982|nr:hypothetical protein [Gloeobacter morelensis]UFP97220.1 hypothetical protein ISF26_24165 [Gloeobacter morelensis MG652769]